MILSNMKYLLLCLPLIFASCRTEPALYDWGQYETSIYRFFEENDTYNIQEEIDTLSREVSSDLANNKLPPPGLCMHLGYLFSLENNQTMAIKYFELEKKHFSESQVFVDGILKRIANKKMKNEK